MKLSLIFTYKNKPQLMMEPELLDGFCYDTIEEFEQALLFMSGDAKNLLKASCSIITDGPVNLPAWYMAANGKFFFEKEELEDRNIQ